ncbi:hypothetical protein MPH_02417 [Macrophomina phaseolina MS6]|uniref:Uncharacterized protein n=1 Tax=Macrophomina phaseolina (strain MS6) TaxID=1126212 RepID=K2SD14_MACPH|nr:hypothetical protein MPH_02417 [Macrophomina phaseolina MS6]
MTHACRGAIAPLAFQSANTAAQGRPKQACAYSCRFANRLSSSRVRFIVSPRSWRFLVAANMSTHSQATSETYNIYRGVWINWTHGRTLGLTLTLTRREGDLLIAFTALFVTVVGTSFWRIACFVVHSLYSSHDPRDGLYHQRQAVLRNSANGTSGLIRLVQILLAWRKNAPNPVRRVLPVICFAVLSVYGFGAASGFSSRVSTGVGNEVLISSGNCATNVAVSTNITQLLQNYWPYATRRMAAYSSYAQQCYGPSDDQKCDTFVTKSLNVQIMRNATCPFSRETCKTPDQNIFFDTGLLDTHDDLGFNTPPDQRFLYRRTTHCAPLTSEGHKSQSNYTGHDPNFNTAYMKYFYGPKNSDVNETATYKYPLIDNRQSADRKTLSAAADYSIGQAPSVSPPLLHQANTITTIQLRRSLGYQKRHHHRRLLLLYADPAPLPPGRRHGHHLPVLQRHRLLGPLRRPLVRRAPRGRPFLRPRRGRRRARHRHLPGAAVLLRRRAGGCARLRDAAAVVQPAAQGESTRRRARDGRVLVHPALRLPRPQRRRRRHRPRRAREQFAQLVSLGRPARRGDTGRRACRARRRESGK